MIVSSINKLCLYFFFEEDRIGSVPYLIMLPSHLNICDFQSCLPYIQQAKNVP